MQRIVTFGCSITYGHGLSDCHIEPDDPGPVHSKQAWPSVLSKLLNVPVTNQSECGISNLEILYKILSFDYVEGDCVVVMWTYTGRDLIFGDKNLFGKQKNTRVGVWQHTEFSNKWMDVHSMADTATRAWFYIHHATLFLESKGITVYNVFADYGELKRYKPKAIDVRVNDIGIRASDSIDKALDNRHPGPKTHMKIANKIGKIIC